MKSDKPCCFTAAELVAIRQSIVLLVGSGSAAKLEEAAAFKVANTPETKRTYIKNLLSRVNAKKGLDAHKGRKDIGDFTANEWLAVTQAIDLLHAGLPQHLIIVEREAAIVVSRDPISKRHYLNRLSAKVEKKMAVVNTTPDLVLTENSRTWVFQDAMRNGLKDNTIHTRKGFSDNKLGKLWD